MKESTNNTGQIELIVFADKNNGTLEKKTLVSISRLNVFGQKWSDGTNQFSGMDKETGLSYIFFRLPIGSNESIRWRNTNVRADILENCDPNGIKVKLVLEASMLSEKSNEKKPIIYVSSLGKDYLPSEIILENQGLKTEILAVFRDIRGPKNAEGLIQINGTALSAVQSARIFNSKQTREVVPETSNILVFKSFAGTFLLAGFFCFWNARLRNIFELMKIYFANAVANTVPQSVWYSIFSILKICSLLVALHYLVKILLTDQQQWEVFNYFFIPVVLFFIVEFLAARSGKQSLTASGGVGLITRAQFVKYVTFCATVLFTSFIDLTFSEINSFYHSAESHSVFLKETFEPVVLIYLSKILSDSEGSYRLSLLLIFGFWTLLLSNGEIYGKINSKMRYFSLGYFSFNQLKLGVGDVFKYIRPKYYKKFILLMISMGVAFLNKALRFSNAGRFFTITFLFIVLWSYICLSNNLMALLVQAGAVLFFCLVGFTVLVCLLALKRCAVSLKEKL